MKALVLGADASAGVAVVQALGRAGVTVHAVCSRDSLAATSRHIARLFDAAPDPAGPELLPWLRDLDARECYTCIIPTTEISLRSLQECADGDPLRRKAVLASGASIETALDKAATWSLARDLGIPVPAAFVIAQGSISAYAGSYPVVLKTLRSQVLRNGRIGYAPVCIARHCAARDSFIAEWGQHTDIQQQEWIDGSGWGIECLYEDGKPRWWFAHERLHELPLTGGASTYRRACTSPPEGLVTAAHALLDALAWHGVAMVEFRVDSSGRFVLLEVNPRLWGSLPLAIGAGMNFPVALLHLARAVDPGPQPGVRANFRMRDIFGDLKWMRQNWRADHADPLLRVRPRLASLLEWLRVLNGSENWDHFSWRDPGPGIRQLRAVSRQLLESATARLARTRCRLTARRQHGRTLDRISSVGMRNRRIAFLCYGNVCRSPIAEHIARSRLPGWTVLSGGLNAASGSQPPAHIQRAATEFNLDLSTHRATDLPDEIIRSSDLVLVMDLNNFVEYRRRFPGESNKMLMLGLFATPPHLEIADPIEMSDADTLSCAAQIRDAIDGLAAWIKSADAQSGLCNKPN